MVKAYSLIVKTRESSGLEKSRADRTLIGIETESHLFLFTQSNEFLDGSAFAYSVTQEE